MPTGLECMRLGTECVTDGNKTPLNARLSPPEGPPAALQHALDPNGHALDPNNHALGPNEHALEAPQPANPATSPDPHNAYDVLINAASQTPKGDVKMARTNPANPTNPAPTRTTPCGVIRGTGCQWPGVEAYKGIRYATASRWEKPVTVESWEGTYDATAYGNCCYQPRAFYDEALMPKKAFYYHEFREGETYTYDEDCLFLNVWTPEGAGPGDDLPVIFYIHGGGFTGGCGHEKHFDGPVWPTRGCVAVTINYRLGPLGFICLPELAAEAGHTGNYAFFDQLSALEWVQRNIASFGGDPANVTIMGQSAGAMSVQQLCLSPLARGLFAKAVMSSGGGVSPLLEAKPAEDSYAFGNKIMAAAGCKDLAELRAASPEALFSAWNEAKKGEKGMGLAPVTDGEFIVEPGTQTVKDRRQAHVPYLIGMTSEDIMPPILYGMAKDWCRTQADQGGPASYAWFFDRQLPGDDCGAWHSSDLWYWFGTLGNCWRPFAEKDQELSDLMVSYLVGFARSGNPNGEGLPRWDELKRGQSRVMRMGEKPAHMGTANVAKLAWTMAHRPAVGE